MSQSLLGVYFFCFCLIEIDGLKRWIDGSVDRWIGGLEMWKWNPCKICNSLIEIV